MDGNKELESIKSELRELKELTISLKKRVEVLEDNKMVRVQQRNSSFRQQNVPEKKTNTISNNIKETIPKLHKKHFELKIGQLLNRLGVIAVILGLSFFLKYSFDNQWIGPTGRIIIGIVLGVILWVGGERTKKKYKGYAYGLLGGGSLAIFFSVYAGYNFYDLYSQVVAFMALIVVMTITVVMSVRHKSLAIGMLGVIGGYTTPLLVSSGDPSPTILFGYLTLLTVGVLGVAIYRKWTLFNYSSFFANQLYLVLWFFSGNSKENLGITMTFLIVLFCLYLVISSIYNIKNKIASKRADTIIVGINAFAFFIWGQFLLRETFLKDFLGFYAILMAIIYILLARVAYRISNEDKSQFYILSATALILITIAMPLQLDGTYLTYAWLAESIAITFVGFKLKDNSLRLSGILTFTLSLLTLQDILFYGIVGEKFIFNHETAILIFTILSTYVISCFYTKHRNNLKPIEIIIYKFLKGLILLEIFIFLTIENSHFFYPKDFNRLLSPEQLSLSGLWMVYAIVLFVVGIKRNNPYFRYSSLGLIGIIIVKAFLVDLAELQPIYKIILFIILGVFMLGISYVYQKKRDIIIGSEVNSDKEVKM